MLCLAPVTEESGAFSAILIFSIKDLFTVVYLVAKPLYCSEVEDDLVMMQTLLSFMVQFLNDCQKYNHTIIPFMCSFPII